MNLTAIEILQSGQLVLESFIFDNDILILMKNVVHFELKLRDDNFFAAELILKFDKFVFEFDPKFPLIVKIIFKLFFSLFEFFPLVFEHELKFPKIMFICPEVYLEQKLLLLAME